MSIEPGCRRPSVTRSTAYVGAHRCKTTSKSIMSEEFASAQPATGAQDARLQQHGLSPKTSLHSRCRLQHPTPPHFGQNPPHLPGRGNGGMVSSRYCKVNNNTCRQFVAPFIRLRDSALPHDTLPRLWHRAYPCRARCGIGCRRGSRQKQKIGGDIIAGHLRRSEARLELGSRCCSSSRLRARRQRRRRSNSTMMPLTRSVMTSATDLR